MKRLLCIGVLFFGVGFTSEAQIATNVHNEYWWLASSDLVRIAYVIGFVDGANQGQFWSGIIAQVKGNTATKAKVNYVHGRLDYNTVRYGQFKDGLDEFYKDYKNKSIHVDDAIGYVTDSIRGMDQDQLNRDLEDLRKQAVSTSYDPKISARASACRSLGPRQRGSRETRRMLCLEAS